MPISIGDEILNADEIYIGRWPVSEIYSGADLIWPVSYATTGFRVTEGGVDFRTTEGGDVRVTEGQPTIVSGTRATQGDDTRITEGGDIRISEGGP